MDDNSKTGKPKRIRRTPEASRAAAIQAARQLLTEQGPAAVTLQAVARAANMTHGNLSHHFGTSAALHAAMILEMAGQLTRQASLLVSGMRAGAVPAGKIVDVVFDGFAAGGYGPLIARITATGESGQLAPLFDAIKSAVGVARGRAGPRDPWRGPDRHEPARPCLRREPLRERIGRSHRHASRQPAEARRPAARKPARGSFPPGRRELATAKGRQSTTAFAPTGTRR